MCLKRLKVCSDLIGCWRGELSIKGRGNVGCASIACGHDVLSCGDVRAITCDEANERMVKPAREESAAHAVKTYDLRRSVDEGGTRQAHDKVAAVRRHRDVIVKVVVGKYPFGGG